MGSDTRAPEDRARRVERVPTAAVWSDLKVVVTGAEREQESLVGDSVARARKVAGSLIASVGFGDDAGARVELDALLDATPDPVGRYASRSGGWLVAARSAERTARARVWIRQARTVVLVASLVVAFGLIGIADWVTGPGDLPRDPPGWPGVLLDIGSGASLLALALGIWAAVGAFRGTRLALERDLAAAQAEVIRIQTELDDILEVRWVRPAVQKVLAERQSTTFASRLRLYDATRYGATSDRPIETRTVSVLDELMRGSAGTCVGLCGPRGVGKTTRMQQSCLSRDGNANDPQVIGIVVDVPVAYEPRDFLTSLYSRFLDEVERRFLGVKPGSTGATHGSDSTRPPGLGPIGWLAVVGVIALVVWQTVAGDAARAWVERRLQSWSSELTLILAGITAVLVAATLLLLVVRRRRRWRAERSPSGRVRALVTKARHQLSGDVAVSYSAGRTLGVRGVGSLERAGTRHVSRGPVPYPALVQGLRDVMRELTSHHVDVRVGIDELDKLAADDARSFLNGLKALFGVPGVRFVVSVSEDAMSDFERRGVPIRDAFDTSLDEIVRIEELRVEESLRLLGSRSNYEFPVSFAALCHCQSGGLPRELLRVARKLTRYNKEVRGEPDDGRMATLCWRLVAEDLAAKSSALWVAARGLSVEPYGMRFRSWLAVSDEHRSSAEGLLGTCKEYLRFPAVDPAEVSAGSSSPEWFASLGRLDALALEFVGYRYFAVTLLEFFSSTADEELRRALRDSTGLGGLEKLSAARKRFADDPRLAWLQVSQFRKARGLEELAVPTEGWRFPAPTQEARHLAPLVEG